MNDRILLVEDENELRQNLAEVLEINGYAVTEASNGQEALELMALFQPDLIVSDIMMPNLDGYGLLKAVRSNPLWVDIPVILLSALIEHQNVRKGMAGGAEDYLTKPIKTHDLVESVKSRLHHNRLRKRVAEQNLYENLRVQHQANLHGLKTPTYGVFSILEYLRDGWAELEANEISKLFDQAVVSVRQLSNNILKTQYYYEYKEKDVVSAQGKWVAVPSNKVHSCFLNMAKEYKREEDLEIRTLGNQAFPEDFLYRDFIFQELAENAFKFSEPGEKVVLSLLNNKIEVKNPQQQFEPNTLNIHELKKPFEPRNHNSQGLTLGLYLLKKYLNSVGYHLTAKTDEHGYFIVTVEK